MIFAYPLNLTFNRFYSSFHFITQHSIKLHFLVTLAFDLFVFLIGMILFNILLTKIDKKRLKVYENYLKTACVALHQKLFPSFTQNINDQIRMSKTSRRISGPVANIDTELLLKSSQKIILLSKWRSSFLVS